MDVKTTKPLWAGVRGRALALVVIVVVAYGLPRLVQLWGVSRTAHFQFLDMPVHLTNATLLARSAGADPRDPYLSRFPDALALDFATRWPTGVYEVAGPLVRHFGPLSIWTTQLLNLLFTAVLVLAVMGLGACAGSPRAGVWGALLVVLCPALAAHSWYFSLDYPLVAMVAFGLLLLWRTRGFARLPESLSLGLWSGLGLWIKYNYALYLLAPSVVALVIGLRGPRRGRALLHAAAALAVALPVVWLLARPDVSALWLELAGHAGATTAAGFTGKLLQPWTAAWLLSVFWLASASFPAPLLALTLPGLAAAHGRRWRKDLWPLLAFLWGGGLVLTLMSHKLERYVQPLYPVLCLLCAWACCRLLPDRWRARGLWAVTATFAAVLLLTQVYPLPWTPGQAAANVAFMFELRTPDRQRLAGLRRLTHHPTCDLRPLELGVAALLRGGNQGPLGVGALWREPPGRGALDAQEPAHFTYLAAAQVDRRRLLIPLVDLAGSLPERARQLPRLLLLHRPNVPVLRDSGLRALKRRPVPLTCGASTELLQLTLAGR